MPRISTTDVIKLYAKQDGKCFYCGDALSSLALSGSVIDIDHRVPMSVGGKSKLTNYCLACRSCNTSKSSMPMAEFMERIRPYRDGVILKKDVTEYNKYLRLHKRFGHIANSDTDFEPSNPITIAEYSEILCRFDEVESSLQEIFDRLEVHGISKHVMTIGGE